MTTRYGVWLPLFDELADARVAADLASQAENAGWDGFFVWDHLRWREPITAVADTWVTLTAIAAATRTMTIGPLVTPLPRRRPAELVRQTATLDRFSGGRLVLGVGLGSDRFGGEYSPFGEHYDDRTRAEMTDESLDVLQASWSGRSVQHHGRHYTVDDVQFLPTPTQQPGIPIWVAGFPGKQRPLRRAARYDGFFPVNLKSAEQFAEAVGRVAVHRQDPSAPYDYVISLDRDDDPTPYVTAGATWCITEFDPTTISIAWVRDVVQGGPWVTG
jgi:alkanesulfonate monooxygenase SsuD/methylene tetrahydromethanopterin reductase-like flavin-dependent oxidoreductase (luciferase family)